MTVDATHELVERLKATRERKQRATMAGLVREPVTDDGLQKACDNCIYYLPKNKWCDLPELDVPVDPDWYCDLWRV